MLLQLALQFHAEGLNSILRKSPSAFDRLEEIRRSLASMLTSNSPHQLAQALANQLPQDLGSTTWGRSIADASPLGRSDSSPLRAAITGAVAQMLLELPREDPSAFVEAATVTGLVLPEETFEVLVKGHYALHVLSPETSDPIFDPLRVFLDLQPEGFAGEHRSSKARIVLATLQDLDPWLDPEPKRLLRLQPCEISTFIRALPALLNASLAQGAIDVAMLYQCASDLWARSFQRPATPDELVLAIFRACSVRLENSHSRYLDTERLLAELPNCGPGVANAITRVQKDYSRLLSPVFHAGASSR